MERTKPSIGPHSRRSSATKGLRGKVVIDVSMSLDGFISGPDDSPKQPLGIGGDRLFDWFSDGDTPSRWYPSFKMSAVSAELFDEFADRVGAVVAGRRTYEVSDAWGGDGPQPGIPLFGNLDPKKYDLSVVRVIDAPGVTHNTYRVVQS